MLPPPRHALFILGAGLLVALAIIGQGRERVTAVTVGGEESVASPSDERAAQQRKTATVTVDVAGAVRAPGVYELAATARVRDAIAAAGGVRSDAQVAGVNRASRVVDGQQILVPTRGPEQEVPEGQTPSINSSPASQLEELPGIGPTTAAAIVEDRERNGPFASVEDLDRVPGVGPGTVAQLQRAAQL